ncbi:olfactory receptor 5V1-like [Bufo gargarizans]|uniref:olfactory receptor 5V1-like n=1 Tax=Bufo gargarizans TaxID=30331 RepID=UPI001CF5C397|nr:olfactory receptor 5V1-like [Bufo gargarizans]
MGPDNHTKNEDFILIGLSSDPKTKIALFALFSLVYTTSVTGNMILIITTQLVKELHTPMYRFICNLALLDITFTSVTVPKMLIGLLLDHNYISYVGCFAQLYFFHFLGSSECFLLSIMGYDRYVAICHPLHYSQIIDKKTCIRLASGCWITGFLYSLVHTILTSTLSFCASKEVNHFLCDMPPLLKLSCTDTKTNVIVILGLGGLAAGASFLLTIISYCYIISTILQIHSTEGRHKAFSTCASHLMIVLLFYGTIIVMYLRPQSSYSMEHDKMLSVFYNVITPMLNPMIYSMRNKEVKRALRKLCTRRKH